MFVRKDPVIVAPVDDGRGEANTETEACACAVKRCAIIDFCRNQMKSVFKIFSDRVSEVVEEESGIANGSSAIWNGNEDAGADVAVTFPMYSVADGRIVRGVLVLLPGRRVGFSHADPMHWGVD